MLLIASLNSRDIPRVSRLSVEISISKFANGYNLFNSEITLSSSTKYEIVDLVIPVELPIGALYTTKSTR